MREEGGWVEVGGLARWVDGRWQGKGRLDGQVFALAGAGHALYVGGSFTHVDGLHSPLLDVYRDGALQPVLATGPAPAFGSVLALGYVWQTRCLYVGGHLKSLSHSTTTGYTPSSSSSRSSNLRSLCLYPPAPSNCSATTTRDACKPGGDRGESDIDASTDMRWDQLHLSSPDVAGQEGGSSNSTVEDELSVRFILATSQLATSPLS